MKTLLYWWGHFPSRDPISEEIFAYISDIQDDAREGTVLVEDVRPLVEAALTSSGYVKAANELCSKHPNLFPK